MAFWHLAYTVNISPARGPSVMTQCVLSLLEGESRFGHSGDIGGRLGDLSMVSFWLLEPVGPQGCTGLLALYPLCRASPLA